MKMVNTLKRLISIFSIFATSLPVLSYSATQSSYPTKWVPVAGDKALITDSADGNKTKQATVGSFPISTATQTALDGKETKAVVQASAPADTTVDWYDTDQESGVLVLKRHNGTTWVRASSHGVQYAPNCAGITAGMCVDTDDGKLYYHNNTSVVEVGTGTGSGISHATADGNYYASKDNTWASLSGVFAAHLGADDNYVTDAEKTKLGNLSGTNTGDQDLSGYSLTSSVLTKTNTTAFSPTGDYHPATKKYVDDSITAGGGYTDEQAQDAVGAMLSGNTETGITVTYNDSTGKVDFVVATQSDVNFTSTLNTKLAGIATGAEVNVNADWNASSGDAQILNKPSIPTAVSQLSEDSTHRTVSDTEKTTWNAKQASLGFTPENAANKGTANGYAGLGSDGKVPSSQLPYAAGGTVILQQSFVSASTLVADTGAKNKLASGINWTTADVGCDASDTLTVSVKSSSTVNGTYTEIGTITLSSSSSSSAVDISSWSDSIAGHWIRMDLSGTPAAAKNCIIAIGGTEL